MKTTNIFMKEITKPIKKYPSKMFMIVNSKYYNNFT